MEEKQRKRANKKKLEQDVENLSFTRFLLIIFFYQYWVKIKKVYIAMQYFKCRYEITKDDRSPSPPRQISRDSSEIDFLECLNNQKRHLHFQIEIEDKLNDLINSEMIQGGIEKNLAEKANRMVNFIKSSFFEEYKDSSYKMIFTVVLFENVGSDMANNSLASFYDTRYDLNANSVLTFNRVTCIASVFMIFSI